MPVCKVRGCYAHANALTKVCYYHMTFFSDEELDKQPGSEEE